MAAGRICTSTYISPCVQAQLRICGPLHSTHVKIPVPLRLTFVVDEASLANEFAHNNETNILIS